MKKQIYLSFCLFFLAAAVFPAKPVNRIIFYVLKGPSGIGMVRLLENPPVVSGFEIRMEALARSDLMAAKFLSGEAMIGMLPPDVAAKIASSGKNIQIAAVTGTGMLSLLSTDRSVNSYDDLRGKTVEVAGQGAAPDYVFRKILTSRGIDPENDINLNYSLAYPEIAQALILRRVSLALLPEPFSTMARQGNPNLAAVGDIQGEWARLNGNMASDYPMTVLAVDGAFAAANSELINTILEEARASIEWVKANPGDAAVLVEKHDLGLRAAVAGEAIPKSGYTFIPAVQARPDLEALYKVFLEFAPVSIGGALPPDAFYLQPRQR
ncbi:MAG: ABC transporter substrate-binding protein [Treponema sp.]|nr:ABC transporter substrate-binding protein [Treponema sp.]